MSVSPNTKTNTNTNTNTNANAKTNTDGKQEIVMRNGLSIHEWKSRDGSMVQKGDIIATAVVQGSSDADGGRSVPTPPPPTMSSKPRRARIRNRKGKPMIPLPRDATKNGAETVTAKPTAIKPEDITNLLAPLDGILRIKIEKRNQETLLGVVEPCSHPAVIDKLCAVCGKSVTPQDDPRKAYIPEQHQQQSKLSQVTVSGGITMAVSEQEAKSLSQQNTERLLKEGKLSLVLDLDHTLVHATADPRAVPLARQRDDVRSLLLPSEGSPSPPSMHHHSVKLRPHVRDFLNNPLFEMTVYTAGTRLYAEQITMVLSRFMVGAKLDHQDILKLQHNLKKAKEKLEAQLNDEVAKGKHDKDDDDDDDDNNNNKRKALGEGDASDGEKSKKRRKVTFGGPPKEAKTDETDDSVEDRVKRLKRELKDAETKEKEALELRQRIFGSRIVSRTDVGDLGRDVKSLKRIFPCGGTMAVVVDDREDVWANAEEETREPPQNLLLVKPYHWKRFSGFADVNNAAGVDITDEKGDEQDNDEQLVWTKTVLAEVHKRFYASEASRKKTVPQHLQDMRREILCGCRVVLSGLVPLHRQQSDAKPRHYVVRHVQRLGAELQDTVDATTTHVVASRDGTDKILQARKVPGCFVVKAAWLMECVWSLQRRNELSHLLGAPPQPRPAPVPAPTARATGLMKKVNGVIGQKHQQGDDDDDDDDGDFEDVLFNGMDE